MRRREFIAALGAAAAAWPSWARAQPAPVIGFVGSGPREGFEPMVTAFREGLRESGYTEGRTGGIECRWAEGRYERLPSVMADMVRRPVAVLVAAGGIVAARAAKEATSTIPVVFATGADPVTGNIVSSLSHPGGNVTGVFMLTVTLATKRLELLRELVPAATSFAMLTNPNNPNTSYEINELRAAARPMGRDIHVEAATGGGHFRPAFRAV